MKKDAYKKLFYFLVLVLFFGGLFFFTNRTKAPEEISSDLPLPGPLLPGEGEVDPAYKELITKGHQLYLEEKYEEALVYFKQALRLEQNDRIYRSLYSSYLGLKDYKNAEIAIKKAASGINKGIPNNWLEYAFFEVSYMKASFEIVSQIYLDALKATDNNIDIITGYASYLVEMKKYDEAIKYLELAITVDSARKSTFQAEIDYLRGRQ